MKDIFNRIRGNPFNLVKRALSKTIIGPIKYGRGEDYNASKYWHDRFSTYGLSLKAVGDEGLSEAENEKLYTHARERFLHLCRRETIHLSHLRVLEIGCGTGFYTRLLCDAGVRSYMGIDVTDVFFSYLREVFPSYLFLRKDVTTDKIEGEFELVVMIDVLEHIVNSARLDFAIANVKKCLTSGGIFIVAPIMEESRQRFFYLRFWSLEDVQSRFHGYNFSSPMPFRNGSIVCIRKP
jgi:SAM-dependent methyltransferase